MKTKVLLLSLAAVLWAALPTARGQTSLISTGTVWRYLDDGSDQGTTWRSTGFNDSGWSNGVPLFGAETPGIYPWPIRTPMPTGGGRITYYFRTHFNWTGPIAGATLNAFCYLDDGAAFYLNGVECGRVRLTNNPVLFDSLALNQGAEGTADVLALSAASLVSGDNVLAVEVHQFTPNSSDLVFGMTLEGNPGVPPLTLTCASNKLVVCETGTNLPAYSVVTTIANATANGRFPRGRLTEGRDGSLYGTMSSGGSNNAGTVFAVNKDGSGYAVLRYLDGNLMEGGSPVAGLTHDASGVLYGAASAGGSNNAGTVFRLNPDGTGFAILRSFTTNGADARNPQTALLLASDGVLYGTANAGGVSDNGAVFKLNRDGSGYTVLRSFNAAAGEGNGSAGDLIEGRDGVLYGTTENGPSNRRGTVFRLNKDGSGFAVLHGFNPADDAGAYPGCCVYEVDDLRLAGTTAEGGAHNGGVVFTVRKDGTGFTVLHHFSTNGADGLNPRGGLAPGPDGYLYGTTELGGSSNRGTIFRLRPDGNGYTALHSFTALATDRGLRPQAGLLLASDGALYGTTQNGGSGNNGLLFKLDSPCPWTFDTPTVTDACCASNVTLTVLSTVASGSNPLTVTRTWQATDCCSNTATCSQTVTVGNPPTIVAQPQSLTVTSGQAAAFSVVVMGTEPVSYRWEARPPGSPSFDYPICKSTGDCVCSGNSLRIASASLSLAGEYRSVVSNAFGSVTSAVAVLAVVPIAFECCSNPGDNLLVNPSFETPVVSLPDNFDYFAAVTGWSVSGGPFFELWNGTSGGMTAQDGQQHLELNASNVNQTVSQVVTGLRPGCPATFCFWHVGRTNYDARFRVDLIGSGLPPIFLDPPPYVNPASWQRYAIAFTPNSSTLTVAFTGLSGSVGSAHIDNVCLTQPLAPPSLICAPDIGVHCGTPWDFTPPTASSCGCSNLVVTVLSTETNGTCSQEIRRTWLVTDSCGFSNTCSQTVTVVDALPPVFTFCSGSSSGNLVPNPGFEDHTGCPFNFSGQIYLATGWMGANGGSSDYFHPCALDADLSTPNNVGGAQTPHDGIAYAGLHAADTETSTASPYREYVQRQLSAPLVAGRRYIVSFHVSLSDYSRKAVDNLGAHLSASPLSISSPGPLLVTPQVRNPAGSFLSSKTDWMLIQGVFTASGGEQYLTIGNFYDNANTPISQLSGFWNWAYYYIDDVEVLEAVECGTDWTFETPIVTDLCCTNVTVVPLSTVTNVLGECRQIVTRVWQATDCCSNSATCVEVVTVVDTTPPEFGCVPPSPNLVQNGSFENGSPAFNPTDPNRVLSVGSTEVSGWTLVQNGPATFHWWNGSHPNSAGTTASPASEGDLFMYFNGSYNNSDPRGKITTSVTFPTAGGYRLEFDMWSESSLHGSRVAGLTAEIAGLVTYTDQFTPPFSPTDTPPFVPAANWQHVSHDFTVSTPGTYVLSFTDASVYGDPNVSVFAGVTPSPFLDNVSIKALCCDSTRTVECGSPWSFTPPPVHDICCGTNVTLTSVVFGSGNACSNVNTIIWTATDCCSNSITCTQRVVVVDTAAPVVTCPADKTVECGSNWTFDRPSALDVCCGTNVTITPILPPVSVPGTCPVVRITTQNWEVADCCGNLTTCSQTVTVVDTTPPMLRCPEIVKVPTCSNSAPVYYQVVATDACDASVQVVCTPPAPGPFPLGTTTIQCTATDDCGNTATCSFPVVVFPGLSFWQLFPAGYADCYKGKFEPAYRGNCLNGAYPAAQWKNFDDPTVNRFFGLTWNLPHSSTYLDGWLRARMKDYYCKGENPGDGGGPLNDTMSLGLQGCVPGSSWVWTRSLGTLLTDLGLQPPPARWCNIPDCGPVFWLHLNDLPPVGGGNDVLPILNAVAGGPSWARRLDMLVQDDTMVDFAHLWLKRCPPQNLIGGIEVTVTNAHLVHGPGTWTLAKDAGASNGFSATFEFGAAAGVRLNFEGLSFAGASNDPVRSVEFKLSDPDGSGRLHSLFRISSRWGYSSNDVDCVELGQLLPGVTNVQVLTFSNSVVVASNTHPAVEGTVLASFPRTLPIMRVGIGNNGSFFVGVGQGSNGNNGYAVVMKNLIPYDATWSPVASVTLAVEGFEQLTLGRPEIGVNRTVEPEDEFHWDWFASVSGDVLARAENGQLAVSALGDTETTKFIDVEVLPPGFIDFEVTEFRAAIQTSFGVFSPTPSNASLRFQPAFPDVFVEDDFWVNFDYTGSEWALAATHSNAPLPMQRVLTILGTTLDLEDYEVAVTNPVSISVSELPHVYWPSTTWFVDDDICHRFLWNAPVTVSIGGTNYTATELRFLTDGGGDGTLRGLRVQTTGAEALVLVGLETGPIRYELDPPVLDGDDIVIRGNTLGGDIQSTTRLGDTNAWTTKPLVNGEVRDKITNAPSMFYRIKGR